MAPPRRRVSYVIPPPTDDVPRLRLPPFGVPRNGSIRPLLIPSHTLLAESKSISENSHPRHRLGAMSLALDTTTRLEGRNTPEGILYTGGRDGLVISWDLGLPFKRRHDGRRRRDRIDRWEMLTGMGDETLPEEAEEDERRDGDVLGDVKEGGGRRPRGSATDQLPYELQWQLDVDALASGSPSSFRQCAQTHTDWVNDLLLCNYNQTVVSASSDGTIKAWHPHAISPTDPSAIGSHADYARCLSLCREQNWIASGSFDRTIKLWDLTRASTTPEPFLTLNPPDATAPKASVYAIASDPYGHAIASGSPERVIRMWDPRSGKRTGKLVGHTDNIRAILISDDSRYLLTGSADASIKLWSLSSQRCLHTFAYHTDSVWSLHSTHSSLEVFYSGDKSGNVCKVDVEGCADVADGACMVVARESSIEVGEGINTIVTADDGLLWTASGNSSISRWRLPKRVTKRVLDEEREHIADGSVATISRRHVSHAPDPIQWSAPSSIHQGRRDDTIAAYPGVPLTSLVRLTSPDGPPFSPSSFALRGRDPEVATLYSAASIASVPGGRSPLHAVFQHCSTLMPPNTLRSMKSDISMSHSEADPAHDHRSAYESREFATDANPLNASPDAVIPGSHGLVRAILLNDRMHALTVDTNGEVAVWDIVRGVCRGWFAREEVRAASRCGSTSGSGPRRDNGSVTGGDKERSPREALEAVRERIEGEAVSSSWSSVDTKAGVLTVHINERCFDAEIYADEAGFDHDRHFTDELRFNIGRWVLRNLFLGFIREEQRIRRKRDTHGSEGHSALHRTAAPLPLELNGNHSTSTLRRSSESSTRPSRVPVSTAVVTSATSLPAVLPSLPSLTRPSPLLTPMIPLIALKSPPPLSTIPQSPQNDDTPVPRPIRTHGLDPVSSPPSASRDVDYFSPHARRGSTASTALSDGGDFSAWSGPSSGLATPTPSTPSGGSGFIGRLKSLGKGTVRKATSDTVPGSPISSPSGNLAETPTAPEAPPETAEKSPVQLLLANPISPPTSSDAPTLMLPPAMTILISDEVYPGWRTVYRGSVSTTWADVYKLESTIPLWLAEYLLFNKITSPPIVKVSFVLLPWPGTEPGYAPLPELLNTSQSKLTSSRFLRVRKLTHHVQEKLDKISGSPTSLHSPAHDGSQHSQDRARGEDLYEILCNDSVLPLDMTLAAVRHYFWRQAGELVMHYRSKIRTSASNGGISTRQNM
ncbi:uncharacterized protein EDB91DRAFT_1108492 [Suillus paluster]|uniref:uncharacterized protein n=1 Tax=Suillus paluster TaxID=48578 RepID=UPI001B875535|nr:uncharacterized protein EDB91DRAFT_1108492 [Suillus paluster]KAG1750625.1 hypothetical protein EDB91DRAFT_1108492 [Suillus paluster]